MAHKPSYYKIRYESLIDLYAILLPGFLFILGSVLVLFPVLYACSLTLRIFETLFEQEFDADPDADPD